MKTGVLVLVLVLAAALVLSGCTMLSPEIVTPKTALSLQQGPVPADCFFIVNESAHSTNTGSSQEITVNGFVSTICSQPFRNLTVRGIFSGRDGHTFATAEDTVGSVGFHEIVPFSLTIDTDYTDLYSYRLEPVLPGRKSTF